ncbi:RNA methyltransferase [Patescibacteria group bacterium]|nr:RNA methyltransferase [Patescibacteria group bacterium]MBU1123268.1 RNA methyltransferase [Patescibacteria group bacterium]
MKHIVLLAYNIRSLWNVGSLFRTSDAFGVEKLILTGYSATPPRREISKTAIGAEEYIKWEHIEDPIEAIGKLKEHGFRIVALELSEDAVDVSQYQAQEKTCLIVGHEVTGVPEEILGICDDKIQIPMMGKKESLNVAVATGIALSHIGG